MRPTHRGVLSVVVLLGTAVLAVGESLFDESRAGTLDPLNGKVRFLRAGQALYTDQSQTLKERPEPFKSAKFILGPFDGSRAACTQGGVVFMLALLDVIQEGPRQRTLEFLAANGWAPVPDVPPYTLFYFSGADRQGGLYWKEVAHGDIVTSPPGSVLAFVPAKPGGHRPPPKLSAPRKEQP